MSEPRGLEVLLVEDDPGERWIMSEILRSRGHGVTACETAEAGWDRYREEPHPLVLLDWLLPGMDGLELCRRIREHPMGDRSVIVVVTSRDEPEDLEQVLRAGADDYVTKPIDVGLLNIRLAVAEKEVEDVRARKRTQDALEARSRELRHLFDNLDEVFFTISVPDETLVQVSPAARAILGRSPRELTSDPELWRELLYPRDVQERQESGDAEEARSLTRRYEMERPDGSRCWLESTVKATRDEEGRLKRVDGTISDITEQRTAQEELSARNAELRTLFHISAIVLSADSLDEAYGEILDEVSRATGYPVVTVNHYDAERERLVQRAAVGLPDREGGGRAGARMRRTLSGVAVRTGEPVAEADAHARTEYDPTLFHGLELGAFIAVPMFVRGKVVGTLALAHDRSFEPPRRLVRWAGSLANSIATLMDRLAAQEALRKSERRHRALAEELKRANDELEAFAYSVSHDLRTPLRTMEGFAHALLEDVGDELDREARHYLERIIASGKRAEELIRDLLAYSRLSSEELQLQAVHLDEVVAAARDQVARSVDERDAVLEVQEGLPRVRSHQGTLVQALVNLLSNALKFVPGERRPRIRIGAERGDGTVRLWVEDNGIGIREDQHERIFRVFERLAESGHRPGTGIGLAIVRRNAERLGGDVGVESEEGEGSRFWIEIPLDKDGPGDPDGLAARVPEPSLGGEPESG